MRDRSFGDRRWVPLFDRLVHRLRVRSRGRSLRPRQVGERSALRATHRGRGDGVECERDHVTKRRV